VSAGVQYRFSEVSAKESVTMGRKGSHILDDGTLADPNPKLTLTLNLTLTQKA